MSVPTGPCSWPIDYASCVVPNDYLLSDKIGVWESIASSYLWSWTQQRFGLCEVEISPCLDTCTEAVTCPCSRCYGVSPDTAIRLSGPVDSVSSVVIDGVTLDPSQYQVDSPYLVRIDGGVWPSTADRWAITYMRGIPVPPGGQVAAATLAVELWRASCGDPGCQLPKRIQTITRQGVSVAMIDSFDDVSKGRTGIWSIDSWLSSINDVSPVPKIINPQNYQNKNFSVPSSRYYR